MTKRCKHCRSEIREINFGFGPEWMHVKPKVSFPTERNGGAWLYCKGQVAEPED